MNIKNASIGFLTVVLLPVGLIASSLALLLIPFFIITIPVLALGVAGKGGQWLTERLFDWLYPNKNAPVAYSLALPELILQTAFTGLLYPFAVVFSLIALVCITPLVYPALAGVVAYETAAFLLKHCFKTSPQKVGEELPLLTTKRAVIEEDPFSRSTYGTFYKPQEEMDYSHEKEVVGLKQYLSSSTRTLS